jgi:glycosyltransferase involved in cell wall biosynthesis
VRQGTTLGVAILTLNEEANIAYALKSVCGWADEVLVLDSGSTDRTLEIINGFPCRKVVHPFVDYGKQRNVALNLLRDSVEWVLFLDADERVPAELKAEIDSEICGMPRFAGYFVRFRLIWQGRWIRRGYYPTWILRLVRAQVATCEERSVNEHLSVIGPTGRLDGDLIHEDRKDIGSWIEKHNRYATREAEEAIVAGERETYLDAKLWGTPPERTRWLRVRVWNRLPPIARPFAYFGYRYFLRGGFLDGTPGLTYHFLQALWFQLLIDLKYLEARRKASQELGESAKERRLPSYPPQTKAPS